MRKHRWSLIPVGIALLLMAVVHGFEPEGPVAPGLGAVAIDPVTQRASEVEEEQPGRVADVDPEESGRQARGIEPASPDGPRRSADPEVLHLGVARELIPGVWDATRLPKDLPDGRRLHVTPAAAVELRTGLAAGRFDAVVQLRKPSPHRGGAGERVLLGDLVLVAAVNQENAVRKVTTAQLRGLSSGMLTNWNRLGGQDLAVRLHGGRCAWLAGWQTAARDRRDAEDDIADPEATAEILKSDAGGLAFLPRAVARRAGLSVLEIDGLRLKEGAPISRGYPLAVPVQFAVRVDAQVSVGAWAAALRPCLRWLVADRSWEARSQPRRPGLDIGQPLSGGRRPR